MVSCTLPVFKQFCCCCCCLFPKFFRIEIIIVINIKLDLKIPAFRYTSNGNFGEQHSLICGLFDDEKQNWPQAMSKCYDVKKQSHCPVVIWYFYAFDKNGFCSLATIYGSNNIQTKCCFILFIIRYFQLIITWFLIVKTHELPKMETKNGKQRIIFLNY